MWCNIPPLLIKNFMKRSFSNFSRYIIPLPLLTPSLSRVTVLKLKDFNPENFDALKFFAHSYNILEIRIREDIVLTDTLIYDLEGIQFGHVTKLHLGAIRKAALVLEVVVFVLFNPV